jgi:RNA polymerase sigma-70 factor (ECF subfamily)
MLNSAAAPFPWSGESERLLIQEARTDSDAFARLYERYRDTVYRYLLSRTGTAEEAEDLLQQVFLRAMDALSQYQPNKRPFVAWLLGIARNLSIDSHRRRRSTVPWDGVPEVFCTGDSGLEAEVLRREELSRLGVLFAALPADKRELLVLRFAAGLTVREIAVVIGKSEAATKKQISRTLETLKEHYHDNAR